MPGCLSYIVAKDTSDAKAIWITEAWDSKASHEASLSLPSVKEAIAKGRPLIAVFGERVVTSGMDRIFPRDLPVGTVMEIKPGNPFKQIRIKPAANLERLEEVLVLLSLRPLETKTEAHPADAQPSAPNASVPPPAARR